ncbi:extracellular solute-binding protein [Inquilinus limosus]|uniref:Putrescine-binding periplasmic protein n=1 Tax=Inquilinus limosus MP06 TaxID=1398085 RepID=A0A0A0DEC5_9PROT|nr:extracellular solute-binding protein [Inquilinus limosus]KGM35332.1 spermidine/putrescine ABC transporter substrate-binding protein [Inquilinus limosus MP06]
MGSARQILLAAVAAIGALTAASAAQAAGGELYFYNWSNYYPPELLKKFEAETGIKVTLDVYDSNETLLAKLQAGAAGYDVVVPSDYMLAMMIKQNLLQEIDAGQMADFKNVGSPHDKPWYDPERKYSAPYMWGTTGFSYDTAKVEGGKVDDSWWSIFNPDGPFKGKLGMMNDPVEVYKAAAMYLGINYCTESSEDAGKIFKLLEAQKPSVSLYNSDGTIERMIAGEVAAHMQWNGAAHRTKEGRPTVTYVYPKEGINFWNDNFAVPVGAKNVENAKIFIDWMMKPENIAIATNFTGYNNAIKGSPEFMDPKLRDDPAVNTPQEMLSRLNPNQNCSPAAVDLRDRVWTRLKS